MPRDRRPFPATLLLLVSLAACGGSPADPGIISAGPLTARVDGASFAAVTAFATHVGGFIAVGSSNSGGESIGFAVQASAAGTYTFGSSNPANATYTSGSDTWAAGGGIGSGSVVITTLDASHVVGTFSFQGVSGTGTPATRSITQGAFDVEF